MKLQLLVLLGSLLAVSASDISAEEQAALDAGAAAYGALGEVVLDGDITIAEINQVTAAAPEEEGERDALIRVQCETGRAFPWPWNFPEPMLKGGFSGPACQAFMGHVSVGWGSKTYDGYTQLNRARIVYVALVMSQFMGVADAQAVSLGADIVEDICGNLPLLDAHFPTMLFVPELVYKIKAYLLNLCELPCCTRRRRSLLFAAEPDCKAC